MHCRARKPVLTPRAAKLISNLYAELRLSSMQKNLNVTVRALEALIRLATAAAKLN